MSGHQVSVRIVEIIVHAAGQLGVDADELLDDVGVDPRQLADPDGWIPIAVENRLWEEAERRSGLPCFGLAAARCFTPGMFGVIEYTVRASATIRDSFRKVIRYNRLTHETARFSLQESGGTARYTHRFRDVAVVPHRIASEFTLAVMRIIFESLMNQPLVFHRVGFIHEAFGDVGPYREVFGDNVVFGQNENFCVFDAALLDAPVRQADPGLAAILDKHAEMLLQQLPDNPDIIDRVRCQVAAELHDGPPSIGDVAEALHMSVRSLQRKLSEHNLTFSALVERLRRDLAERHLGSASMSVAEVGYVLGYSEPSAFHRAFKRWYGVSPGEYRAR